MALIVWSWPIIGRTDPNIVLINPIIATNAPYNVCVMTINGDKIGIKSLFRSLK